MLCEANVAGAQLPAEVVDFMTRHRMQHDANCAENIDGDQCFCDKPDLSADEICKLAGLLEKWDIRSSFAGAAGGGAGGGGGSRRARSRSRSPPRRSTSGGAGRRSTSGGAGRRAAEN